MQDEHSAPAQDTIGWFYDCALDPDALFFGLPQGLWEWVK